MQARRPVDVIKAEIARVDARRRELRQELSETLAITAPGIGAKRWRGAALALLKEDYETTTLKFEELAQRHRTSAGTVHNLADKYKWVRRAYHEAKLRGGADLQAGASA